MGKKQISTSSLIIAILVILLSACALTLPATPTAIASTDTPTALPSSTATPTLHPPKHTPIPTFDLSVPLATYTPQADADCPPIDSSLEPDTSSFNKLHAEFIKTGVGLAIWPDNQFFASLQNAFQEVEDSITEFLSSGGDSARLKAIFDNQIVRDDPQFFGKIEVTEVTGDSKPEIFVWMALPYNDPELSLYLTSIQRYERIFSATIQQSNLFIFTCETGAYTLASKYGVRGIPPWQLDMPKFFDLNGDGVDEIILPRYAIAPIGQGIDLNIISWDGNQLKELIQDVFLNSDYDAPFADSPAIKNQWAHAREGSFEIMDIDNNGTTEVVISSGWFGSVCHAIDRDVKLILQWDGQGYSGYYWRTPPNYRIQAIWDGDEMTQRGLFSEALAFYDAVINDASLLNWSMDYNKLEYTLCENHPDWKPIPENPEFDQDEPIRLGAYAYYRKMLVYVVLGDIENAQETYENLATEYQSTAGEIYIDLASAFWDQYSMSGDMDLACNAANSFVVENKDEVVTMARGTSIYPSSLPAKPYLEGELCPFGSEE